MNSLNNKSRLVRLIILLPVLIAGFGCKLADSAWESLTSLGATPTQPIPSTQTTIPLDVPTASPIHNTPLPPTTTPTSTSTSTFTPQPQSPTPLSPTPLPSLSPTPLSRQLQLDIFEELWGIVNDEYLYSDFNGLDWNSIRQEYRKRIEAGISNDDFYSAMSEMIFRLGDDHSSFLSPEEMYAEEAEFAGKLDYVGIGILARPVPERRRAVILVVFPDSPAQEAGLQSHDNILSVDGEPILDEEGRIRDILRGPEGSSIHLQIQTPGQEPRSVTIPRERVGGPIPVPYAILTTPEGKRIGYILLITFIDRTVVEQVGRALQIMSFGDPLDGVILDNRMNEGGSDTVLSGTLAYFTHGDLGSFVSRKERRSFKVQNRDMLGSQQTPLVVLIGESTVSFGEIFAGILQNTGRAYLIGETTLGNVEILWGYDFNDGSRAWIAHETFQPLNPTESDWETSGIIPDLAAPVQWDEVTLDTDPAVIAALEYMDR